MKISQHYLTFPFYIPRVIILFKNWPLYLFNYLFRKKRPAEYQLRNGYRIIDGTGTLAGTLAVVFIRQEYGPMKDFQTILDIGSNMGSFMVYAAQSCPNAKIFCYEPVQQNYNILMQNMKINSLEDRVCINQYAVTARNGQMVIALDESPMHSFFVIPKGSERQIVNCLTLREIFSRHGLEKIDLLKINCEGAEYEILENCSEDDFERIPNIKLEFHNLDSLSRNGAALAHFLKARGYEIKRFTKYLNVSGFIWATRQQSTVGS